MSVQPVHDPGPQARVGGARATSRRNVFRTGIAVACAFSILAVGAGWWQVVEAQRLAVAPDNPAVIAIARRALRGPIEDRNGQWLARSDRDANGEATREYRDDAVSHVVGYASRRYGTAGLERAYNAELLGLQGVDPLGDLTRKFNAGPDQRLGLRLALDLRLQRAAVRGLGKDKGAVVMLDPATGEILAMASTPVYDASAIADPDTATATFKRLQADDDRPAAAPLDARSLRARVGVQDRHRHRRPQHGRDRPWHDLRGAAAGRGEGARGRGLPGPGRAPRGDRRHGPRHERGHGGQLQHLVRAGRTRDRRRPPGRRGRQARVRGRRSRSTCRRRSAA